MRNLKKHSVIKNCSDLSLSLKFCKFLTFSLKFQKISWSPEHFFLTVGKKSLLMKYQKLFLKFCWKLIVDDYLVNSSCFLLFFLMCQSLFLVCLSKILKVLQLQILFTTCFHGLMKSNSKLSQYLRLFELLNVSRIFNSIQNQFHEQTFVSAVLIFSGLSIQN